MKPKKRAKLKVLNFAIFRTPAFSLKDNLDEKWIEFLEIIRGSSPAFYGVLVNTGKPVLEAIDNKIKFSTWKYFNRARYRATPYGNFASFTTIEVSDNESALLIIDRKMLVHEFIDWKEKDNYTRDVSLADLFEINSSVYNIDNQYRYLRTRDGIFEISAVNTFDELDTILKLCRAKIRREAIHNVMKNSFGMSIDETNQLLTQMSELQLLFTDQWPNITGEDYFKRIGADSTDPVNTYAIAERKLISGNLNNDRLNYLEDAINFLSRYLPPTVSNDLSDFRKAFLKKFEQKAVPLARAMDLETGIGYGNLGQQDQDQDLVDFFSSKEKAQQPIVNIPFTQLHRFLLNKIINGGIIKLEEFELQEPADTLLTPNTLSVLLHFCGDNVIIESAGGCTANAMLGRFTLASNDIEQFGLKIADIEEQANPGVIFFDIAYQAEKQVDNVNRRKRLYKYELPVLTWSCDNSAIHFDDILVFVREEEIILWSKNYKKRMVPRIASAYNYSRSDLAVYRFLCDLQHQHIKSDINFRLKDFFSGLSHYPRVVYKSVIVSPAMWLVPKELLKAGKEQKIKLLNWLQQQEINFPFKAGNTDQTLCFDPGSAADLDAFFLYWHQYTDPDLYITEALISTGVVHDQDGNDYAAQFVVQLGHGDVVYKPYEFMEYTNNSEPDKESIILPGGDWLYFEIYCHPYRADSMLRNTIKPFLKKNGTSILKWFFVRYQDPKPHVRLRLQLRNEALGYPIMNKLKSILEVDCIKGLISDVQVKTYFRETERYGTGRMPLVEQLFCYDSQYALRLISKKSDTNKLYSSALLFMQELINICVPGINDQIALARIIADSFSHEFDVKQDGFKKLNQSYQEFKSRFNISETTGQLSTKYKKVFIKVMDSCESEDQRDKLLADLLHMHINRLFNSDQRTHELILYHYLLKMLVTQRACTITQQG